MRFAAAFIALCATVTALPAVDTSSVTDIVDTSSIVPDTSSIVPDTSSVVPDTSNIAARQDHPGPGKNGPLYKLLGKELYHEISLDLHTVGIAVAHLEQELSGTITSVDPDLHPLIRSLLQAVDTLEADLVSLGFNT